MTSDREELAKMIDPHFRLRSSAPESAGKDKLALAKADRIIAAGWTPPEPASGAQQAGDVREAAARGMAFASRDPNDMSRDAEEFWANSASAPARYLAMAAAAIRGELAREVTEEMVKAGLYAEWRATCGDSECCPPPNYDGRDMRRMRAILTAALQPGEGSR